MPLLQDTVSLVLRLEGRLRNLESGNSEHPGNCSDCHQDAATTGHHEDCALALDLQAVDGWKQSIAPWGDLTGE